MAQQVNNTWTVDMHKSYVHRPTNVGLYVCVRLHTRMVSQMKIRTRNNVSPSSKLQNIQTAIGIYISSIFFSYYKLMAR